MQLRRLVIASAAALGAALLLSGCGRNTMATVNGEKITKDEFYNRLERLNTPQGQAGPIVLNQLIQEKIWMQLAEKEGVTPTKAQIDGKVKWQTVAEDLSDTLRRQSLTPDEYRKQIAPQLAMFNVLTKGIKIKDEDIKRLYESGKDKMPFTRPEQSKVSVIMCNDKAKSDKAMKAINGGKSFADVAKQYSDDDVTKGSGGAFGAWFFKGMANVPPQIVDVVVATRPNQVSQPFQVMVDGKMRWYIVKVNDRRPARSLTYAQSKDFIKEQMLAAQAQSDRNRSLVVAKAFSDAKFSVGSDRYKGLVSVLTQQQKAAKQALSAADKK